VNDTSAVFFDVDFTLIYPGPRFQGSGYQESCRKYAVDVDPARFEAAVAGAARVLDSADELYDADLYVRYTARIIELMGGTGPVVNRIAREMYDEWAENHHFALYDDVKGALQELVKRRYRVGLISNSHRCLESFQSHFDLAGLIDVTVSSSALGYMKPHPTIFRTALERMQVEPSASVMVGDSLLHDVGGARRVGMRGVWLVRGGTAEGHPPDVPTITTLAELPAILAR
jgi:HAD superfamily hydrolase (TIGR01662 family)